MTYAETPHSGISSSRPFLTSYDLGYEFSQEHYIELQCMVEDADAEGATFAGVPQLEETAA
jgi:hypothetical protein